MSDWLKANGGPLAVVVLGLGLAGFTTPVGWAIAAVGSGWWIGAMIWKHFPWEIRRKPAAIRNGDPPAADAKAETASWAALNEVRERRYAENHGLFLIHTWRPSHEEGQVADVEIRLWQHGPGPLTSRQVEAVEYTLGPKFSDHSRVSTDPRNGFAIEESMWGPMLCLAKVYLAGGREPLLLERYINFEGAKPVDSGRP